MTFEPKLIIDPNDGDLTLYNKRIKVCNECEYKSEIGICKKCGCVLAIKARFEVFKCPLNKW